MNDEIEVSEFEIDKYGREVRIDRWEYLNQGGTYFAWMKRPVANLETLIPEGVKDSTKNEVYDEEGNLISSEQKNVLEFVGGEDKIVYLPDDEALIPACKLNPNYRQKRVGKADIDDWDYYGLQVWGEEVKFLPITERDALLEQIEI